MKFIIERDDLCDNIYHKYLKTVKFNDSSIIFYVKIKRNIERCNECHNRLLNNLNTIFFTRNDL